MPHRRAPYLTVAAVTAAFLVGGAVTPATAGAAKLTKRKVEAIAAKVVDQKAPALKVGYAATAGTASTATRATTAGKADDSALLGGKAGADYLTKAYTLSTQDLVSDRGTNLSWTFSDLPAGTYLLQYDLRFSKDDQASAVGCSVKYTNYPYFTPESGSALTTGNLISGSTVVSFEAGHEPELGCGAQTGTFTILPAKQGISTISLLRVDSTSKPAVEIDVVNR